MQRGSTSSPGGGGAAELVERALEGYAGLLDPSRRRAEVLRSRNGGQRDPRTDGGEQLLGSEATCDGRIRGKNCNTLISILAFNNKFN